MSKPSIIAIDGPVASGKSTIGRLLARRLGYRFVDTGMMYRALTWQAIKTGTDPEDEEALSQLANSTAIDISSAPDGSHTIVDGRDVTAELTSAEVEASVSLVSKVGAVRSVMVQNQQSLASKGNIVMAGRDIGTTVLPHAELKVYLIASVQERARRRHLELLERGQNVKYDAILAELIRRDEIDSKRDISPLQPAADAKVVDSDGLSIEQVVAAIIDMAGEG